MPDARAMPPPGLESFKILLKWERLPAKTGPQALAKKRGSRAKTKALTQAHVVSASLRLGHFFRAEGGLQEGWRAEGRCWRSLGCEPFVGENVFCFLFFLFDPLEAEIDAQTQAGPRVVQFFRI